MTTLLLVLAHPDDESMGNGTLVARHATTGCAVHLVCATRGAAGWHGRPPGRSREELPAIRTDELERAAQVLGLASVEIWDYPDGGVPACDQEEISDRIREAVQRLQPDAVVGWGPDGGYGHPDHIAVGACTDRALAGTGLPHYRMGLDRFAVDAYLRAIEKLGVGSVDMAPVAVERVDAIFEPSAQELTTVRRAIECHDSQRNAFVEAVLGHDHLLFWMARNSYVRVTGSLSEPATDLLPELSAGARRDSPAPGSTDG